MIPESVRTLIPPFMHAPAVFAVWVCAFWLVKRVVFFRIRRWVRSRNTSWDGVLRALSFPVNLLIWVSGLMLLANLLPLPEKMEHFTQTALQGALIFSLVVLLDRLAQALVDQNAYKKFFGRVSPGLVKGISRGFILGLGLLIFLDLLGISITPILASLGIGSLAVALALQDTLSNFFAGLYVAVDKPVQAGDFVRLETGDEGYVTDVGWRSTKLRTRAENTVIIPNSKLIGSVITNYHLPTREVMTTLKMGVQYGTDLERVERVVLDVARDVLKTTQGGAPEFEPAVRFQEFGDSSVNFTVAMHSKEISDSPQVIHDFIKKIHARFQKEGIVIPYPVRTLDLSKEAASELQTLFKK